MEKLSAVAHVERVRRVVGELGASLVEYVLLVAVIAVMCIGGITFVGAKSSSALDNAGTKMATSSPTPPTSPPTTIKCKKKKGC